MSEILRKVREFISAGQIDAGGKWLVAVSGGMDSMTLLHVLQQMKIDVAVAHCNFQLRGDAADADQAFVESYCAKHGITCHSRRFQTAEYAENHQLSIQLAARKLRYDYFDELIRSHHYRFLATAHHLDDRTETILMSLLRGKSTRLISDIPAIRDYIIRPFHRLSRAEIEQYAVDNHVDWRDDASNEETKYLRNLIRHQLFPVLQEINPSIRQHLIEKTAEADEMTALLDEKVSELNLVSEWQDGWRIGLEKLDEKHYRHLILKHLLQQSGMSPLEAEQGASLADAKVGAKLETGGFSLLRDRDCLLLRRQKGEKAKEKYIFESEEKLNGFELKTEEANFCFEVKAWDSCCKWNERLDWLDADELIFPLVLRNWEAGDRMRPLGMAGEKKVSDILVDEKIPLWQKQNIFVLEDAERIVWLSGIRISEEVRITENTKRAIRIERKA